MSGQEVIDEQLEFYKGGNAGCLFLAHAAKDPGRYGWRLSISNLDSGQIDHIAEEAISTSDISTQSILFPTITNKEGFKHLLRVLSSTSLFLLEQAEQFKEKVCLGYRVPVGAKKSWVTGFGDFSFLPNTRQSPYVEITFRSKPRPDYDKVMKEAPSGVIHVADMHMRGMDEKTFKSLWYNSIENTKNVIGHEADLRSAAKTTFSITHDIWKYVRRSYRYYN